MLLPTQPALAGPTCDSIPTPPASTHRVGKDFHQNMSVLVDWQLYKFFLSGAEEQWLALKKQEVTKPSSSWLEKHDVLMSQVLIHDEFESQQHWCDPAVVTLCISCIGTNHCTHYCVNSCLKLYRSKTYICTHTYACTHGYTKLLHIYTKT